MPAIKDMNLKELNEALAGKSKVLYDIQREAGPDLDMSKVTSLPGDSKAKVEALQAMNRELDEIGSYRDPLLAAQKTLSRGASAHEDAQKPAGRIVHPDAGQKDKREVEVKDFGTLFVETPEYKQFKGQRKWPTAAHIDVDLKTVMRLGAGWAAPQIRLPGAVLSPQRPIRIMDFIPMLPTSADTIRYMLESTFTNNAAEVAEQTATTAADAIGEAALALTETTDEVEWLPVFIPVTMQQLEDVEGIEAYVTQRLQYMLQARLDSQILNGNGSTPNLLGTVNVASINTQAKGTDATPDAVYKGMTLVRAVGMAEPSAVFANPYDWQAIRLLRTADGVYIWGSPSDAGTDRIWGVPVVQSTAVTENTIVLGDYANFSALYTKRGINVEVSDSHASYFTRGLLAIRADMRVAMVHFRVKAFCLVTGV